MEGAYDLRLVALSVVVAEFASSTALWRAGRGSARHGTTRWRWFLGGAFAVATGIWSMRFIGLHADAAMHQPERTSATATASSPDTHPEAPPTAP